MNLSRLSCWSTLLNSTRKRNAAFIYALDTAATARTTFYSEHKKRHTDVCRNEPSKLEIIGKGQQEQQQQHKLQCNVEINKTNTICYMQCRNPQQTENEKEKENTNKLQ